MCRSLSSFPVKLGQGEEGFTLTLEKCFQPVKLASEKRREAFEILS
jgi:hypothetical protein